MRFSLLVPLLLSIPAACTTPPRYGMLEGEPDAGRLQQQIRAGANEVSLSLTNQVASVTFDVLLESDDPRVRRAALVFWNRVGDEAGRALFHQDPVASAVDLIALVLQLQAWLAEGGDGADCFGPYQERVRATVDTFADRLETVIAESESVAVREDAMAQARAWADAHPLQGLHLARVSVAPLMGQLGSNQGRSVFGMADSVESSISSIETRMEVLGHRLPAQTVTQAVLILDAYLGHLGFEELVQETREGLKQVEGFDQVLARERAAILVEVDRQREETLTRVDAMVDSLELRVSAEREALLERTESMRAETLKDLERQRQETVTRLEAMQARALEELGREVQAVGDRLDGALSGALGRPLDEQRAETLGAVDDLGHEITQAGLQGARELVDIVFLRALVVAGLFGACLVGAAAVLRRRAA